MLYFCLSHPQDICRFRFVTKNKDTKMFTLFLFLFLFCIGIHGKHFNGGTIRWEPIYPNLNLSSVPITIIQSYSWTYPTITCATNVPISTSGRSSQNSNLTCVTDCSTDGGYSTKPINILTDCQSASSSLGMMTSQRSVNITFDCRCTFLSCICRICLGTIK